MIRATFFMEQHIGHRAYYENLKGYINRSTGIDPAWVEITYQDPLSLWQRIPLLPQYLRGSMTGRQQVRRGLRRPADVRFFNTQVPAALGLNVDRDRPFVLATDMTPKQYDEMAAIYSHQPDKNRVLQSFKQKHNTRIFQRAAYLFPWSSWTANSLISAYGVRADRVEVLPPGVDLQIWQPNRQRTDRPVRILFVGGDFQRKGGDLLLRAYQRLCQQVPGERIELALVTRDSIPETNGVRTYANYQPNSAALIRLYQASDLFVLPSRGEAFGIAAVEASAAGLPVVASRVGGLSDIVDDGQTGFLIEPGQFEPLFDRICRLVENPELRLSMGRAARQRAERLFNAAQNAARVVEVLQAVTKKG